MSLILGLVAGIAYGVCSFAGALLALPLLVVGLHMSVQAGLPVALAALSLCCAIAAGDAVRARQCDAALAVAFAAGAAPLAILGGWLVQTLPAVAVVAVFAVIALANAALLWRSGGGKVALLPAPMALWRAPKRSFQDAVGRRRSLAERLRAAAAGALSAAMMAVSAAPGIRIGAALLGRLLPGEAFELAGTLALGGAAVAVIATFSQLAFAPLADGYVAGLYVLGAVAGTGVIRRVDHARLPPAVQRGMAAVIALAAVVLVVVAFAGGLGTP